MGKEAKYVVRLSAEERQSLEGLVAAGRGAADKLLRARILLKADVGEEGPGWTDARIGDALEVSESTVHRLRQRLVEAGVEAALVPKPSTQVRELKLDGPKEARLIAIACGQAPAGFARWTMQLLADQLVELKIVDEISDETVRRTLKKKRTQALVASPMGNSARPKCGIRLRDGGCVGGLPSTARPGAAAGLL